METGKHVASSTSFGSTDVMTVSVRPATSTGISGMRRRHSRLVSEPLVSG